jgi:hypothetical protein
MGNKRAVIVGGALAYLGVSYGVYKALKPKAAPLASFTPRSDNTQVWDAVATRYDAEIDFDETLVGVKLLRWWLLRNVSGKTLEVSAGTARNLQYYSNKVDSVTITDRSPEMVSVAYAKAVGTMSPEKLKRFTFRTADVRVVSSLQVWPRLVIAGSVCCDPSRRKHCRFQTIVLIPLCTHLDCAAKAIRRRFFPSSSGCVSLTARSCYWNTGDRDILAG